MVGRHGGCFATAHRALSTPEGLSPITNQEIRRRDSCPRGYRHSWSAADGGTARTVSERRPGTLPRSFFARWKSTGTPTCPWPCAPLWTRTAPWWSSFIHEGKLFTSQGHLAPAVFGDAPSLKLNPGDVVVMSGGATGISAHLARALAPFAPRLVFLGRTQLSASAPDEPRAREIAQTLADLHTFRNRGHVSDLRCDRPRRFVLPWRWPTLSPGSTASFTAPACSGTVSSTR